MKYLLIILIKLYQLCLGPFIGDVCRFYPSCSNYAIDAVKTYGCIKGSWLIIKRLSKCHPWGDRGDEGDQKDIKNQKDT